ncbi:MAG: hypothetical protein Ta2A_01170 [Treponemataceae bacterium]|nr:MAG: hypothetical protein Ta2A_01170 [Treponemataceae bacterium]
MPLPSAKWYSGICGDDLFVVLAYDSKKVAYRNDRSYVAAGASVAWTVTENLPFVAKWRSVAYGNERFVAVAEDSNKAAWSDDGAIWTSARMPQGDWRSIAYGSVQ